MRLRDIPEPPLLINLFVVGLCMVLYLLIYFGDCMVAVARDEE